MTTRYAIARDNMRDDPNPHPTDLDTTLYDSYEEAQRAAEAEDEEERTEGYTADEIAPWHIVAITLDDKTEQKLSAENVLADLLATIESTGGLVRNDDDELAPNGDQEWTDLAAVYLAACTVLDHEPMIEEPDRPEGESLTIEEIREGLGRLHGTRLPRG